MSKREFIRQTQHNKAVIQAMRPANINRLVVKFQPPTGPRPVNHATTKGVR